MVADWQLPRWQLWKMMKDTKVPFHEKRMTTTSFLSAFKVEPWREDTRLRHAVELWCLSENIEKVKKKKRKVNFVALLHFFNYIHVKKTQKTCCRSGQHQRGRSQTWGLKKSIRSATELQPFHVQTHRRSWEIRKDLKLTLCMKTSIWAIISECHPNIWRTTGKSSTDKRHRSFL